jgi:putative nucleotidyltransferase with HDIG domain
MLRTRVRAGPVAGFSASVFFALVLAIVQHAEALFPEWSPHLGRATAVTLRAPAHVQWEGARAGERASRQELVIPRGTLLSEADPEHRAVVAYARSLLPVLPLRIGAATAVHFTLFLLSTTYLRRFGPSRTRLLRTQLGLFGAMAGVVVAGKAWLLFSSHSPLWIPVATVPLWCALTYDKRTAFAINVMLAFMVSSLLSFDVPVLAVLITRGLSASLLFFRRKGPLQMLFAGAGGGLVACAMYAAVVVLLTGNFSAPDDLRRLLDSQLVACLGGGILASVLAHWMRHPAERLLGEVSRDRLLDLTDLEQPLLKKMANEAPGSWEHSRAMANLAEAAAAAIGADPLLTRVGAYYHDLGKTIQPSYFVENLAPGERSPHEDLEPDVSADAIMAHVVSGAKLLREGGLPEPVVEFAYTHHGTQTIEYFWQKCVDRGNPKRLPESSFRYPGMRPQTRETAILMLVDSIEAAGRTISPPDRGKFDEMIQRVVFTKLKSGQLDECGLTTENLRVIANKMGGALVNMHHGRIKYPWQREQNEDERGRAQEPDDAESGSDKRTPSAKSKVSRTKPN